VSVVGLCGDNLECQRESTQLVAGRESSHHRGDRAANVVHGIVADSHKAELRVVDDSAPCHFNLVGARVDADLPEAGVRQDLVRAFWVAESERTVGLLPGAGGELQL
jgi:hypothetical protein